MLRFSPHDFAILQWLPFGWVCQWSSGIYAWRNTVLVVYHKIAFYCKCIDISALIKNCMNRNWFGATSMFVSIVMWLWRHPEVNNVLVINPFQLKKKPHCVKLRVTAKKDCFTQGSRVIEPLLPLQLFVSSMIFLLEICYQRFFYCKV